MLAGRASETKYLENCYERDGSQILIVYGRENVGKTSLIMDFVKDKEFVYYLARECSESEQLSCFANELSLDNNYDNIQVFGNYESVFGAITSKHCRKQIIIIDEFQNFLKSSDSFMDEIIKLSHDNWNNQPVMIVLCSSSFSWVENQMVSQIGPAAYEISGFLKVNELSFLDLVRRFPKYSFNDCLSVYSILGGVPGYWRYFNNSLSLKDNICKTILKKGTVLYGQVSREISDKLREPAVYQTILARMAQGEDKLNDLYKSTGFNRAKISVYLKNLMELEMVEKIYSVETQGHDNARKGIYRISNHLVFFWFKFVFPHISMLEVMGEEEFYDKFIAENLRGYEALFFKNICREYMQLLSDSGRLQVKIEQFGSWCGKAGDIDIVGKSESGVTITGLCAWEKDVMTFEDFEWLQFCLSQAKLPSDHYYLFSGKTFDDKLKSEAESRGNISLIDPSML